MIFTPERGLDPALLEPGRDDPGPGARYIERYNGRSGRLSPGARPGDGQVTTKVSSAGGPPTLQAWVPSIRNQAGATISLRAVVIDEHGARVDAQLSFVVAPRGGKPGPEQPMAPAPAGADYQYSIEFPATAGNDSAPATFEYAIRADGNFHGEPFSRVVVGNYFVHRGARLHPETARIDREGGDLAVSLLVDLDRAGTYWGYAELWSGEKPIAFARDRFERQPAGPMKLILKFGGAVIHDSGLNGPYRVRNLRFQQVDAFPPQESEPIAELAATPAWRPVDFY